MQKDDTVYVGHMLDMARQARDLVASRTRAEYDADLALRLALAHLVQNIGEAARRVSPELQKAHPDTPGATSWVSATRSYTTTSTWTTT